jgi:hypothetical protein
MDQTDKDPRPKLDLDAEAQIALEEARKMKPGPERTEAMKRAGILRNAADLRGLFVAKRGRPAKSWRETAMMIAEVFDQRTPAIMEAALERACKGLATGSEQHDARRHIASKILECAESGDKTLSGLTDAGRAAASELCVAHGVWSREPSPIRASQVMPPRAGRARLRGARRERSWSGKYLQTALSPKKSEDDIQREQLGPGGVPGAPDPAKMTPPREKKTPKHTDLDHTA